MLSILVKVFNMFSVQSWLKWCLINLFGLWVEIIILSKKLKIIIKEVKFYINSNWLEIINFKVCSIFLLVRPLKHGRRTNQITEENKQQQKTLGPQLQSLGPDPNKCLGSQNNSTWNTHTHSSYNLIVFLLFIHYFGK